MQLLVITAQQPSWTATGSCHPKSLPCTPAPLISTLLSGPLLTDQTLASSEFSVAFTPSRESRSESRTTPWEINPYKLQNCSKWSSSHRFSPGCRYYTYLSSSTGTQVGRTTRRIETGMGIILLSHHLQFIKLNPAYTTSPAVFPIF